MKTFIWLSLTALSLNVFAGNACDTARRLALPRFAAAEFRVCETVTFKSDSYRVQRPEFCLLTLENDRNGDFAIADGINKLFAARGGFTSPGPHTVIAGSNISIDDGNIIMRFVLDVARLDGEIRYTHDGWFGQKDIGTATFRCR